ncbi:MFS transporter [Nocardioides sp. BP30]|uniref:MFS transporter n=1 Tax=Nocardioides sp. BP30 TaxID=3036374 RepID=UPI002468B023|nr:MFS transporter [Nocardioides sp. BP30]WGL53139.1 MFS transporter [Nocardioides sp. BP30]
MTFSSYASLTRHPVVRQVLVLGFFVRVPLWAVNVAVTLHVVTHLHRSYTAAGVVSMVAAGALAISSPWRGRLLDKVGLRASIAPSLVVTAVTWAIAPFVGYWPLLVLVAIANLMAIPTFSIIRSVLIAAVSDEDRTTVLAIDSVATEISFMVGPILGVLGATYLPTPLALLLCQACAVAAGFMLWLANPPLGHHADAAAGPAARRPSRRAWITPRVLMILLVSLTATVILTSEDLGSVAAMRSLHHAGSLGWVLALWGLGSAVGGIVYGAMHRHPSAALLLVLLAATTALVSVAPNETWFVVLLFVSGIFCAPTITATVDDLSRAVPASVRNEAMGWHGSALTLGSALGAPAIGQAIDTGGWDDGFLYGGLAGLVIALAALVVTSRRRPLPATDLDEEATAAHGRSVADEAIASTL